MNGTSLVIPAGQTRSAFTLTITDDQVDELHEVLLINLGTPSGASLGANDELSITIEDNDPVLSFARSSDTSANESGTITVIATDIVTRDR